MREFQFTPENSIPYSNDDTSEERYNSDSEISDISSDSSSESDDQHYTQYSDEIHMPNRMFKSRKISSELDYYDIPSEQLEYPIKMDMIFPTEKYTNQIPRNYANRNETKKFTTSGVQRLYFSKLDDIGKLDPRFEQNIYKNFSNQMNHIKKENRIRKCYNQKISVAIHEQIQNHYNVKDISILEYYQIFENKNEYKIALYDDFLKESEKNTGMVLKKSDIDSYVNAVSRYNDKLIHIKPFILEDIPNRKSMVILENQLTFITNNIFNGDLQEKHFGLAPDRQFYEGKLMGVPVILKVQDFLDLGDGYYDELDEHNRRIKVRVDAMKRKCYTILMQMTKYSNSKIIMTHETMQKMFDIFFDTDSEALNEAINGICLSNMNHINHMFPFLYYSCLDLELDHERQEAKFKVITIQEKMGLTDLQQVVNDPESYSFENELTFDLKTKLSFYNSLFAQLCFGIADAVDALEFIHFDIRPPNITVEKTNQKYVQYKRNGKIYNVPTNGYIFRLIDFGRSHTTYEDYETVSEINYLSTVKDYSQLYFVDMMKFVRVLLQGEDPNLFEMIIDASVQSYSFNAVKNSFAYKFMEHMLSCGVDSQNEPRKYKNVFEPTYCGDRIKALVDTHPKTKRLSKPFRSFLSCILKLEDDVDPENIDINPDTYIEDLGYFKLDRTYSFFQPHELLNECNKNSHINHIFEETTLFDDFRN